MACDSQAGLEAQKLISISLGKMAASRVGRTGASLHKSLLVASVLHRARHVFLEESYHVHRTAHPEAYSHAPPSPSPVPQTPPVLAVYTPLLPPAPPATPAPHHPEAEDKENRENEQQQQQQPPPQQQQQQQEQTCETGRTPLTENNNSGCKSRSAALKRRRCVSQQETQEAVWSILPKRPRTCPTPEPVQDQHDQQQQQQSDPGSSMEVEHITSLVSIFSFGGQRVDFCGTEAAREDVAQYQPVALAV